jgi:2,3-bisphosphoglycerate-independent phosphoglycerate mutase
MKYIVIVPDGMFDHPIDKIGKKTPLQVANTVNMDFMAKNGFVGLVKNIPEKMAPGSDIGNMSILGYDPLKYHTGRAPIEAANQGIILKDNEIAFRCNLVTTQEDKMVDYSAGHIATKEASELIEALNNEIKEPSVKFFVGKSYRHLMILTTDRPDDFLKIKTTPPHDILNQKLKGHLPHGKDAEFLIDLMERSKVILAKHPINQVRLDLKENLADMIWLWGQGKKPVLPSFQDKWGLKGGIISAVDLVNGLGRLASLEIIDVPGATGYYDTNFLGKAEYALESLKRNDYVYVHIEAPDEAGHNGDAKAKIEAIENIDKHVVGKILNQFDKTDDVRILVLPDHPTPVELRTHTHEPVGFIMYGKNIPKDGADSYDETTAKDKGVKFESGEEMVQYFLKHNL